MNARGLPGFDLSRILELSLAGQVPREAADAAVRSSDSTWHDESKNPTGIYHWHASSLSGCPRAAVLKRAAKATDGHTLEGALTFAVGHLYHALMERGAPLYAAEEPRFAVLALEEGGYHPDIPLAARCDALLAWNGLPVLVDYKTEKPQAAQRRRAEQEQFGQAHPVRGEHRIQLTATAMVMEACKQTPEPISEARILYINKINGMPDQQPVVIAQADRDLVMFLVERLEKHWSRYAKTGELPPRLTGNDETWRCRARSEKDAKGIWCEARSWCMSHD